MKHTSDSVRATHSSYDVSPRSATPSKQSRIPYWGYGCMLLLAAAIWGMGTIVIKDSVDALAPAWLVGIRFLVAGGVLCAVMARRMKANFDAKHVRVSIILGVLTGATYLCNTSGLLDTTASKSVFLTATYCVMVPFVAWAMQRIQPSSTSLLAAVLCIVGVGLIALQPTEGARFGWGDAITLVSALFCALHLVATAKYAPGCDIMVITGLQFLVAGVMGVIGAVVFGVPLDPQAFDARMIGGLAYLAIPASIITLGLQNIAVANIPASSASLFLATESIFGTVFGVALLGEVLTASMVAGFVLVFAAIVVSECVPAWLDDRVQATQ
ncbi:DMT family transporter [Adlercreutzia sp. ZJ141]|uniref:DMT family transporter n=1 Tax=Adlercreutzia sp. ZJ141 TaxID=2709406 RepID=UPI0013E9F532|nr:DMT family transporter [Adlercreutzia sp. ZJ141]